jgi:hypothetical protein
LRNIRHARILLVASLAAICALAMTAGPAAAWNTTTGGAKLSGTLTIKRAGKDPRVCTFPKNQEGKTVGSNELYGRDMWSLEQQLTLTCTNAGTPTNPLKWPIRAKVTSESGKYMVTITGECCMIYNGSPWGEPWVSNTAKSKTQWINATATTPSHTVLNEAIIGEGIPEVNSVWYQATGTIYFTTLAGGQLTYP